jgi:hypothetical protein
MSEPSACEHTVGVVNCPLFCQKWYSWGKPNVWECQRNPMYPKIQGSYCNTAQGVTVHFGPSVEDGSSVSEWQVHSCRHPRSKRTWDSGVVEVINKGDKPGGCASQPWEGNVDNMGIVRQGPELKTTVCASRDKMVYWCHSLNIFDSQLFDHWSDIILFRVFNLPI